MGHRFLRSIIRSAWPNPSIDRLLRAAMLKDESAAAAAWREFETSADFDHLTAGEMRLIGLVSDRLAALAPDSPMRARMEGIGRANWSQSQLVIGEAGGGLRALETASIDMLVMKTAGQVAVGGAMARGSLVNGVDIAVRPEDCARAFDCLAADGWRPVGSRAANAVSTNFRRGQFGRLTLHRTPFPPPHTSFADDASIWQRSAAGKIAYVTVRVPSPTDAVAIGLAHGARDSHRRSDWLANVAANMDRGMDWELFEFSSDRHRLHAPGAIALLCLRERLGRRVPETVLARLERSAMGHPVSLFAALAETRPKAGTIGFFWLARALIKRSRRQNRIWW